MEISIKTTDPGHFFATENLTRETFWNLFRPGCDEHLVLHQLRNSKCYISELDLMAEHDGTLVGHIIATRAHVQDAEGRRHGVLCVGPLSVLPALQGRGIGSRLMQHAIRKAAGLSHTGMILYGHPDYYHRFGFQNAKTFGITTRDRQNFDAFMALPLYENALAGISGRFFEADAFTPDPTALETFDAMFPVKKKGEARMRIERE